MKNNMLITASMVLSPNVLHTYYFTYFFKLFFFFIFVSKNVSLMIRPGKNTGLAYSDRKKKLMLSVNYIDSKQ